MIKKCTCGGEGSCKKCLADAKKAAAKSSTTGVGGASPANIRLTKEFAEMSLDANIKINVPTAGNYLKFDTTIDFTNVPSTDTLWARGIYKFSFEIPFNYPHEHPKVHCDTAIYHPNIDREGNVCLNILRKDWKPVLGISTVIIGLNFLFMDPEPADPLNLEAAKLMRENPAQFARNV